MAVDRGRRKVARCPGALVLPVLLFIAPSSAKTVVHVDLASQTMQVDHDGRTVSWPVSSGMAGYETPSGVFHVTWTDPDHRSDEYAGARMPWSVFFSPRGLAIHGWDGGGFGEPHSHGCVRVSVADAKTLFAWIEEDRARGQGMARIEIVGGDPIDEGESAQAVDQPDYPGTVDIFSDQSVRNR